MISHVTSAKTATSFDMSAHPIRVLAVFSWELRRRLAGRSFWITASMVFVLTLAFMWLGQFKACVELYKGSCVSLAGTSASGILLEMPGLLMLWFAMLVPFLTADLVTLDVKRRTHEILMATPLSKSAYIWGRYLAGLTLCLLLALLILAGTLLMGVALTHFLWLGLDGPSDLVNYPPPNVQAILLVWVISTLPVVFLLSSIGFFFSTLLPASSGFIKALVLVGWLACWMMAEFLFGHFKIAQWDPTNSTLASTFYPDMQKAYFSGISPTMTLDQRQQVLNRVQQNLPDLTNWLLTHALYAALGLVLTTLTVFLFRRFDTTPRWGQK